MESLGSAIVIFLVIRLFAFHAFRIPSESMENTLLVGDFLFVNKLAYGPRIPFTTTRLPGFTHPKPGDVIVFEYPRDRKVAYIKRCVATGGADGRGPQQAAVRRRGSARGRLGGAQGLRASTRCATTSAPTRCPPAFSS